MQTQCAMDLSIFLVHGTFAKDARWTHKDSALYATLRKELDTDDFTSIPWTGANTTRARREGVTRLSSELRKSLSKKPSNQHLVIGHSHGGTIALLAVASAEFVDKVGVVLLSTPILIPRKRKFSFLLGFSLAIGAYFSAAISLVLLAVLCGNTWPSLQAPPDVLVIPCMIGAGIGLLLLYRYLQQLTDFIVRENGRAVPTDIQLVIVRESADEASSFLGAFQLCSRAISMIFTGIEFTADSLEAWTKKAAKEPLTAGTVVPNLIFVTAALGSVSFALYTFHDTFHFSFNTVTIIVILAIAAALCFNRRMASGLASHGYFVAFGTLLVPLWFLAFPIWLLLVIVLLPIREAILSAPFVDLSAETTPEGRWSVDHFVPTAEVFAGWGLSHSAAYNDPRVLKLIVNWVKQRSRDNQLVPD
jgi:hypothetical protein